MSSNISEVRAQVRGLKQEMSEFIPEARETNQLLTIYLALGRRAGDENLRGLIRLFQQGRITAEMLTRAMMTLNAASGPWGWILAGGQAALAGVMFWDLGTEINSR